MRSSAVINQFKHINLNVLIIKALSIVKSKEHHTSDEKQNLVPDTAHTKSTATLM